MTPLEFGEWNARPMVRHGTLRDIEKIFPGVHYHDGVPFIPWASILQKIPHNKPRSLLGVVDHHFHGERLVVSELSTESGIREKTFLRLEYAYLDDDMRACLEKIRSDWSLIKMVDDHRVLFQGQRDPGLKEGPVVGGKASYVLKIGRSDDIARRFFEHAAPNSAFAGVRGRVEFLFGLAVAKDEVANAEAMLHGKLMQMGFAWPVVIHFPKRVFETYEFNAISLPLVHDVVRKLRCVVPPPTSPTPPPMEIQQ